MNAGHWIQAPIGADAASLSGLGVCVSPEDPLPLSDAFAPAVTYYLASMLVLDENSEMSDTLFDRFSDALSSIRDGLPTSVEKILDRYEGSL